MMCPIVCVVVVLVMFCLLATGYMWVDSKPKSRRKHKRINNVRRRVK